MKKSHHLTINIEEISDKEGTGYCAKIPELNNSIICADTIEELFTLIPEAMKEAKDYSFGYFKKPAKKKLQTT